MTTNLEFIMRDHDRPVETVLVECGLCGKRVKERGSHALPDSQLARLFPGWLIKGVRGAKRTRCPAHI